MESTFAVSCSSQTRRYPQLHRHSRIHRQGPASVGRVVLRLPKPASATLTVLITATAAQVRMHLEHEEGN